MFLSNGEVKFTAISFTGHNPPDPYHDWAIGTCKCGTELRVAFPEGSISNGTLYVGMTISCMCPSCKKSVTGKVVEVRD